MYFATLLFESLYKLRIGFTLQVFKSYKLKYEYGINTISRLKKKNEKERISVNRNRIATEKEKYLYRDGNIYARFENKNSGQMKRCSANKRAESDFQPKED